jgi:hypothetical protein
VVARWNWLHWPSLRVWRPSWAIRRNVPKRLKNLLKRADRTWVETEIRVGQTLAEAIAVANKARRHCEQIATLESP